MQKSSKALQKLKVNLFSDIIYCKNFYGISSTFLTHLLKLKFTNPTEFIHISSFTWKAFITSYWEDTHLTFRFCSNTTLLLPCNDILNNWICLFFFFLKRGLVVHLQRNLTQMKHSEELGYNKECLTILHNCPSKTLSFFRSTWSSLMATQRVQSQFSRTEFSRVIFTSFIP